jgi:hypothetical protein
LAKQGDEYYIAMEYVPGVTVGTILEAAHKDKLQLPPQMVVHIISQVLRGLAYAHNLTTPSGEAIGILHRDITPQNIMVTRKGFVKIADFGIAKAVNEISTTSPGMIKGKLGYIAPEQLEGREPDQRVDLFCAGILLWEMLTVRRLFKGSTEVDTFRLISEAHVPPLSDFRSDVRPELEAVIRRALAKDPDTRYARAELFIAALAQAMAPEGPDDWNERTQAFFAANPQLFAGLYVPTQATAAPPEDRTGDVVVPTPAYPPDKLPDAARYTRLTRRPARHTWAIVGGGIALAAAGVGAWVLQRAPAQHGTQAAAVHLADALPPNPPVQQPQAAPPGAVGGAAAPGPAPGAAPGSAAPHGSAAGAGPAVAALPNGSAAGAAAAPETAAAPPPAPKVDAAAAQRRAAAARAQRAARLDAERARRPLSGPEIQAAVQRHQAEVAHCLRSFDVKTMPPKLEAHITIETTGEVSQVDLTPALDKANEACLTHSLKAMRFRRHPVDGLKVTIPLKIQML